MSEYIRFSIRYERSDIQSKETLLELRELRYEIRKMVSKLDQCLLNMQGTKNSRADLEKTIVEMKKLEEQIVNLMK